MSKKDDFMELEKGIARLTEKSYLMTFRTSDSPVVCDFPICKIMGIDVAEIDGMDIREITPEQQEQLTKYFASDATKVEG